MRYAHKMDEITQRARVSIFQRKIARALPATVRSQQQVTQCQKRLVNAHVCRTTEQLLMVSKRKVPFSFELVPCLWSDRANWCVSLGAKFYPLPTSLALVDGICKLLRKCCPPQKSVAVKQSFNKPFLYDVVLIESAQDKSYPRTEKK